MDVKTKILAALQIEVAELEAEAERMAGALGTRNTERGLRWGKVLGVRRAMEVVEEILGERKA